MKAKSLPKRVYIVRESEGRESWLNSSVNFEPFEDGEIVGVYELREVKQKTTRHELI